ncbi:Peroxidase [Mycena venus]|uniref:Peroxidase n=1 Tax=Mycena venus TaxID=2733690 RepID=A0A8H6YQC3_9AGAR|nr:Peroxidase [Mycena venus]
MRFQLFISLACTWQLVLGSAAVFNWPDPLLDNIDDQLYVDRFSPISFATLECAGRDLTTVAAQWMRLAFHDFATHDSEAGTGGLDASIVFELDRPQNIGMGQRRTLVDFLNSPTEYVGMADMIAMGVVSAVFGCGGPVIPFRAGRIDATEAGPETVPEPQQNLTSHIDAFKRMGFNETEMIGLLACGHVLGGVRQADFPLIVTPNLPTGVAFQAPVTFNNSIVHEYLDSTTINVLEVGPNITTRSDLRIFSSDGNVTMKRLASADVFNQECTSLFERMINTVPSTVTLTDPVEPINYKVSGTMLYPRDGSLAFLATLRILDSSFFEKPNTTVTMFWKERQGTFCPEAGCSVESFQLDYDIASLMALDTYGIFQMDLFRFNATIDLNTSISHFWFVVDPKNGSAPFIVDNHGANFTIDQDVVLYDAGRSSFTNSGTVMVVAVKDDSGNTSVTANTMVSGNPLAPWPVNGTVTTNFALDASHPPADGYTFYSSPIPEKVLSNTIHATVAGTAHSVWVPVLQVPGI